MLIKPFVEEKDVILVKYQFLKNTGFLVVKRNGHPFIVLTTNGNHGYCVCATSSDRQDYSIPIPNINLKGNRNKGQTYAVCSAIYKFDISQKTPHPNIGFKTREKILDQLNQNYLDNIIILDDAAIEFAQLNDIEIPIQAPVAESRERQYTYNL